MRALYAAPLLLLLVTGACGKKADTPQQEACCAALLLEGPEGPRGTTGSTSYPLRAVTWSAARALGSTPKHTSTSTRRARPSASSPPCARTPRVRALSGRAGARPPPPCSWRAGWGDPASLRDVSTARPSRWWGAMMSF
ncbi:unnamed protein product [Ectocarpus sp. 6 AP-2014]